MLKNYFVVTLRNLWKQKLYGFINIGGLAVGLACFILILHFVQHELSYDHFHEPIKPLIVDVKEYEYFGVIIIRTEPGKTKEALAGLEKVYKDINPNYPFNYKFLDQEYAKLYKSEQVISKLSNVFAGLAIAVSCLGLLGLAM